MTDAKTDNPRVQAAQRLAELLAQENAALKRLDFPAAAALLAAKEAALADLTNPSAPPAPKTSLAAFLAHLAAENQALLERAIAVQTRIVRIIARAAVPPSVAIHYNLQGGRCQPTRATALAVSTRA